MPSDWCAVAISVPVTGWIVLRRKGRRDTDHCETNDRVDAGEASLEDLLAEFVAEHPDIAEWVATIPTETVDRLRALVDVEIHQHPKPESLNIICDEDEFWHVEVSYPGPREVEVRLFGPGCRVAVPA